MSRRAIRSMGHVSAGDYEGYFIYYGPDILVVPDRPQPKPGEYITIGSTYGKKCLYLVDRELTWGAFGGQNYVPHDKTAIIIEAHKIEKYQEISGGIESNSMKNIANATFMLGVTGTVIASSATKATHSIAIKFKDGKKCVVTLYDQGYQYFMNEMMSSILDDF